MLVATFGPSTGWNGKTIDYDAGVFSLEGHGPISAGDVLTYDGRGYLEWAYDGLREWVQQLATGQTAPEGTPLAAAPLTGEQPPKKKRSALRSVLILVGALVVLAIIWAAIGGGSKDKGTTTVAEKTPAATQPATTLPTAEPTTPAATPSPSADKPIIYRGSGNRIVKIKKPSGKPDEPTMVMVTHNGQANFAVWTLDKQLQQNELLVNMIGNYKGTVPLDLEDGSLTTRIQVEADGAWKLKIEPLASARRFSSSVRGKGDDVVVYDSGPKVATIKHSGSSNFVVWFYGQDNSDLLVNEVGEYKGQSPFTGKALLVITADGSWSIAAK